MSKFVTTSPLGQIQARTHTHIHSFVEKNNSSILFWYLQVEGFENPKAPVPDPGISVSRSTPEVDGSLQGHVKPAAAKCLCEVCPYTLCILNICYSSLMDDAFYLYIL